MVNKINHTVNIINHSLALAKYLMEQPLFRRLLLPHVDNLIIRTEAVPFLQAFKLSPLPSTEYIIVPVYLLFGIFGYIMYVYR